MGEVYLIIGEILESFTLFLLAKMLTRVELFKRVLLIEKLI